MSKVISADVPDDLADRVEDEQEEGESRSAAVRRLVRAGLESKEETGVSVPLPLYIAWIGTMVGAAGLLDASPTMGVAGVVIFTVSMAYYAIQ